MASIHPLLTCHAQGGLRIVFGRRLPSTVLLAGCLSTMVAFAADAPLSTEKLATQLGSGDVPARREASYQLLKLGPKSKEALPALIKALDDPDKQVWSNAVAAIAAIGPDAKDAIPALLDDMDSRKGRGQRGYDKNQALFRSAYALTRIGPAAVQPLIQALNADDAPLRAGAVKALGGMGPAAKDAIPALTANLGHWDNDVQREVIDAFGAIGADAKAPLIDALSAKEPKQRSTAALALAAMGKSASDAAPVLFERLTKETDASVRISFFSALPKIGADPAVLVPRLLEGLKDNDEATRHAAINGLLTMHSARKQVVDALAALLRDSNPAFSQRAAYVLGRLGDAATPTLPALLEILSRQQPSDPVFIDALVQIGEPAVPQILGAAENVPPAQLGADHWTVKCLQSMGSFAVTPVRNGLAHKSASVRLASVRALSAFGPDAEATAPALMEKLDDPEVQVRAAALGALVSVNAPEKLFMPRLEKALDDPSPVVRLAAAQLVPRLGENGKYLNTALIAKLKDPDPGVRRGVLDAFGTGQADAVPLLIPLLDEADLRAPALEALGRIGAAAKPALPKMVALLANAPKEIRFSVLDSLAKIGPSAAEARPAVEPFRTDSDAATRTHALKAVSAIEGDPAARASILVAALDDGDLTVRQAAADATVPLGDKAGAVIPKFFEMLKSDRDRELALTTLRQIRVRDANLLKEALNLPQPELKMYACEALGRMGKEARDTAPALETVSQDSNEEVARAARRALRAIGAR